MFTQLMVFHLFGGVRFLYGFVWFGSSQIEFLFLTKMICCILDCRTAIDPILERKKRHGMSTILNSSGQRSLVDSRVGWNIFLIAIMK